jgi:acid-sensing ion channel, other
VTTEGGVCFTFNEFELYRDEKSENHLLSGNWSLENGYKNNSNMFTVYPQSGSTYSLISVLKVDKRMNDSLCKGPIQGFKIYLHLPIEAPQISKHYYHVPPEHLAQIYINPRMITTAPELRDLPVEKRQCYFSDERHLRFFRHYTQNNCDVECIANLTVGQCGCSRFHLPSEDISKVS